MESPLHRYAAAAALHDVVARRPAVALRGVVAVCRGDLDDLSRHYGVPVLRGPDELKDLPQFFGRNGTAPDLSRHDVLIFAEIARRIRDLARSGIPFDECAILLRQSDRYQPLIEEALRRVGIPAYFSRGARRPDPAGLRAGAGARAETERDRARPVVLEDASRVDHHGDSGGAHAEPPGRPDPTYRGG